MTLVKYDRDGRALLFGQPLLYPEGSFTNHPTLTMDDTTKDTDSRRVIPAGLQQDLDRRFTYHAPKADQPERYTALRSRAKALAEDIARLTPSSREQSLALTHLETAIFFANAAIARNE